MPARRYLLRFFKNLFLVNLVDDLLNLGGKILFHDPRIIIAFRQKNVLYRLSDKFSKIKNYLSFIIVLESLRYVQHAVRCRKFCQGVDVILNRVLYYIPISVLKIRLIVFDKLTLQNID